MAILKKEVFENLVKQLLNPSMEKALLEFKLNPEILSNKPTHIFNGTKVKVFTRDGQLLTTAEIMEGPDAGKWTTIIISELKLISETE